MFSPARELPPRAFVRCMREDGGPELLAARLLRNQKAGILYGWNADYDTLPDEQAILALLRTGESNPNRQA